MEDKAYLPVPTYVAPLQSRMKTTWYLCEEPLLFNYSYGFALYNSSVEILRCSMAKKENGTHSMDIALRLRHPFKTNIAINIIAAPSFRSFFGRLALKHLYSQIIAEPKSMAFVLLLHLGKKNDAVFVWYLMDLLLRVPNEVFEDRWVGLGLSPFDGLPGVTVHDRIQLSQRVLTSSLHLWDLFAKAAKVDVDYSILAPKES